MTSIQKLSCVLSLILIAFGLIVTSCTRKANTSSSTLVIQFPETKNSEEIIAAKSSEMVSGKPNFDMNNAPSTYGDVDCLMVFIAGPEDAMRSNFCEKESDKSNHFKFGVFAGSIAKGQKISLEVPAGNDRVIKIYGMKKAANSVNCPQIADSKGNVDAALSGFSPPFFLGERGSVAMPAGQEITVDIALLAAINSATYFDSCKGPLMGDISGDNDGDPNNPYPGGNEGPYMRLEGLYTYGGRDNAAHVTKKTITIGKCIPVTLNTYNNGGPYALMASLTATLPPQSEVEFYAGDPSCAMMGAKVTSITIPLGAAKSGNFYMKLKNFAISQYEFKFTLSSTEVRYNSDGVFQIGRPKMRANLPPLLVNNLCYPFRIQSFEADGSTPYTFSGNVNISANSGSIYSMRSSASTCNTGTATTNAIFSAQPDSTILYFQAPASGVFSNGINIIGPSPILGEYEIQNVSATQVAGADNVPTHIQMNMPASIEVNKCYKVTLKVMNRAGANVPVPIGTVLNADLRVSDPLVGSFYVNSDCAGQGNWTSLMNEQYSTDIYFRAHMAQPSVQLFANSDYMMIKGASPTFATIAAPAPNLMFASLPSFNKAETIGSHEFTGPGNTLPVGLSIPAGDSVKCVRMMDQSDCTSKITGSVFNWSFNDAFENYTFQFSINHQGTYRDLVFAPTTIYGSKFFRQCDRVLTGVVNLASITSVGGNVNCLASGSVVNVASGGLDLSGLEIIGSTNQMSTISTNSGYIKWVTSTSTASVLANVTVSSTVSASAGYMAEVNNYSDGLDISNTHFLFNSAAASLSIALKVFNSMGYINLRSVSFVATPGGNTASMISVQDSDNVHLNNLDFTNNNTSAVGIHLNAGSLRSSKVPTLTSYKFNGTGKAISIYGSSFKSEITSADKLEIQSTTNTGAPIDLSGYSLMNLKNSMVTQNGATFLYKINGASATLNMEKTVSVQLGDYYAMDVYNSTLSNFKDNHFIKTGGSNSYAPIVSTSATINSPDPSSNLFCATSTTTQWTMANSANKVMGAFTGTYSANSLHPTSVGATAIEQNHCTTRNP